ncbi:MAG: P-loop NTPase [Kofleriaceae bacterium]
MNGQAAKLRVIRGGGNATPTVFSRRSLAVSGGKGGIGKSTVALNLAIAYAQAGARTLVLDTDLGMADLNLLLGVAPARSLLDALGGVPIEDILVQAHGIELLPALNGSYLLSTIGPGAQARLLDMVATLADRFDTLIVDVAAGIGQVQTKFAGSTTDTIVVVNPEPLSMADAYACLKVLAIEQGVKHAYVVPNRVHSRAQADEIVARLKALVDRFLDLEITALPPIPADPAVTEAAQFGIPLLVHMPTSPAARAIRALTTSLATFAPTATQATWWRVAQGESR